MAPGSLPGVMQDAINTDASFTEKEMRITRAARWYGPTIMFIGIIFSLAYGLGTTIMAVL